MNLSHYTLIAELLTYPEDGFLDKLKGIENINQDKYSKAVEELKRFAELLPLETYDLQELYCRSFEVQPLTSLYVGYVLFGDDYKRGDMLAKFSVEHKNANNKLVDGDLPDHLPNVLRLISVLAEKGEDEKVDDMVVRLVAPAVEKMIAEYDPSIIEQKELMYKKEHKVLIESNRASAVSHGHCLKALYSMFKTDFTLIEAPEEILDASFFKFIKNELEVESKGDQSLGDAASCGSQSCSTSHG